MVFGAETVRIVPHSGIQFLNYALNADAGGRFSRTFIERQTTGQPGADGIVPIELRPGWNDDDPDADDSIAAGGTDVTYDINKQKALEPFIGHWVPLPYLAVQPSRDTLGRELFQPGPTNWARIKVTPVELPEPGATHRIVLAFDTDVVDRRPNRAYVGPSREDVVSEQEFALAYLFRDIAWFLSDRKPFPGTTEVVNHQEWMDRWVDELFVGFKTAQRGGRALRAEDRNPLEHAARYAAFIQFLAQNAALPRVKLIDTVSADPSVRPVNVDLVLDIGNSRTCGMLIENFPNQEKIDLGNSYILQLRDLEEPHKVYGEPFESDVQLAQARFGRESLSRASTRARAFFWPSLVRVGPEAARYRERAEGTEAASGMSSPKRYLCDVEPVNQEWRFQPSNYGTNREPPTIDLAARRFMNFRGDVLRQVAEERRFYDRLAYTADRTEIERPATRMTYSRSSFFTLMVAEIVVQALSLINNPQVRGKRGEKDTPRRLRRIIFTMPTAMPVREQRLLRSRAVAAVRLVWDLMGWAEKPPPGLVTPEVHAHWDEASCAQFVYLYSEIAQKFGGNIAEYFELAGRPRPPVDPQTNGATARPPEPSLRVASLDIGGGTTDLMITTYYVEKNRAIVPSQTFREGFRIAGEDVLRQVIQQVVMPAIAAHAERCGLSASREFLVDRFGADRANMAQQDKHLRRQFVLRVLKPVGLALLSRYENAPATGQSSATIVKLSELLSETGGGGQPGLADRITAYVDGAARDWGARDFRFQDAPVSVDFERIRNAVETTLGDVFDNIAEAVYALDCDVVLLSGRPSRLPATVDLFVNKLSISPDRIIPLSNYPAGHWYPFGGRSRFRIEDPKTATVVGCMLCALAESQITNFTLFSHRLKMRSTANYIGIIERDGKMRNANVLFALSPDADPNIPQSAEVAWFAPMPLGFRQLPIERWVATPIYRLKPIASSSVALIQKPVTIGLERELPEELAEYDTKNFSSAEAKKEELRIVEATSRDGANVFRSFGLFLDTLASEEGYWLDTGILSVA